RNDSSSDSMNHEFAMTMREARLGDQAAWGILFKECYPKLLRVVDRWLDRSLRPRYDSADFASEAMKTLVARFDPLRFHSIDSLMGFLVRVAKQHVIDAYRRVYSIKRHIGRERRLFDRGADSGTRELCSNDPTPDQLAEAGELREQLQSLVDGEARAAVLLRQQGYPTSAIARRMGWGVRKVQRVFEGLRDSMEDPGGQG